VNQYRAKQTLKKQIRKVLIANRGEIAFRILRACRRLGIETAAVYSEADAAAPYLREADSAVLLGPPPAQESYLRIERLLEAARESGADAVHPGYGFLSESPEFAEAVIHAGLTFIGPSPECMRLAGHKDSARIAAAAAGLRVPAGYDAEDQSPKTLLAAADTIGFPLLVKAAAGGGGRGMRLVRQKAELEPALIAAAREAQAFFADGRLILEQYLSPARHIEVQIIADSQGNVCHLYDRDCSLQRRYQKIIEIGPAPGLQPELRRQIHEAAVTLGKRVRLIGAATVEFLVPLNADKQEFYFLEINPRIQVEHPVTEMITGRDIVELQLRVASGEPLPFTQQDVSCRGTAVEARVCAEVPGQDFRPSGGNIRILRLPSTRQTGTLRIDHALAEKLEISSHYDSLLAKLIIHADTYGDARQGLIEAVETLLIGGIETNQWFLSEILRSPGAYGDGIFDTTFVDTHSRQLSRQGNYDRLLETALAAALGSVECADSIASELRYFRLLEGSAPAAHKLSAAPLDYSVSIPSLEQEKILSGRVLEFDCGKLIVQSDTGEYHVRNSGTGEIFVGGSGQSRTAAILENSREKKCLEICGLIAEVAVHNAARTSDTAAAGGDIASPLPGVILEVAVREDQTVEAGDVLLVIESMKMEHRLVAPVNGTVRNLRVDRGSTVKAQDILLTLMP
jgi:acetyl/propionyl-CoA carboxylase alpha subunit